MESSFLSLIRDTNLVRILKYPQANGLAMKTETIWEGDFGPYKVSKEGTLSLTVTDERTGEKFEKTVQMPEDIMVNHAVMFKVENGFGLKFGVGAIAGEKA